MKPNTSATGTAIHTPISPNIIGRIRTAPMIKINVLEKDIIADVLPSEKAVNMEEENIPNPIIINVREYILKPYSAIL